MLSEPPPLAPLLEVAHIARRLSLSPAHVRRLLRERTIAAIRVGHRWRVDRDDLDAYLNARKIPAAPRYARP